MHNSFSASSSPFHSDESRPATDSDDLYHFIAYLPISGTLYELDGLQSAPISHGPCEDAQFPEKIIPVLQRRIERYPAGEIRFNLLAVVQDPRVKAREIGDVEMLEREEAKREAWGWENELRRHNFVGFTSEVLGMVVREKGEGTARWIEEARRKGEQRRRQGGGEMELD